MIIVIDKQKFMCYNKGVKVRKKPFEKNQNPKKEIRYEKVCL